MRIEYAKLLLHWLLAALHTDDTYSVRYSLCNSFTTLYRYMFLFFKKATQIRQARNDIYCMKFWTVILVFHYKHIDKGYEFLDFHIMKHAYALIVRVRI